MQRSENVNSLVLKNNEEITPSSSVLSSTVITRFTDFLDVSEITVKAYRSGIKQFITFLTLQNITQLNRETVIMFKKALIAEGRKPSTVALYLAAIRRFSAWLESEGLCADFAKGVKSPKQDKSHKRDALTGSQIKACLEGINRTSLQGKRDYAAFLLMSVCGLRTVEVMRANVGDLQEVQGQACLFVWGKGRADRGEFVKLSAPVLQALREYLSERGQVRDSDPLFTSCSRRNRGGRLTTRTISGIAKSSMLRAGFNSRRLTAHSLRHSAATLAIQGGMSLQEVSAFMRHSSINVTMIYLHDVERMKSQCENAVTAAIFGTAA